MHTTIAKSLRTTPNSIQGLFKLFANRWQFGHVTASPRHPQSSGKVEGVVKPPKPSCGKQFTKRRMRTWHCWTRTTPTAAMHTSPAQRMFTKRTSTLLAMWPVQLQTEPADTSTQHTSIHHTKFNSIHHLALRHDVADAPQSLLADHTQQVVVLSINHMQSSVEAVGERITLAVSVTNYW